MLKSVLIVSKQRHSNINSIICYSFCQFRKNLDKNELNFITNLFSNIRRKTNYDNIFVVMNRYFKFARYIVAKKN